MERINTPIRVGAIFAPGRQIRPVWFDWCKKQHRVTTITYCWQEKCGNETALHFAVSDGQNLYELVFEPARQAWLLAGVEPGT